MHKTKNRNRTFCSCLKQMVPYSPEPLWMDTKELPVKP